MKYKVGQRVKIKSLNWYNENKDECGEVHCKGCRFVNSMARYCDSILTIGNKKRNCYQVKENIFDWTDEMIEGLAEEENESESKFYIGDIVYSKTWQGNVVIMEILPDGFYKVGAHGAGWFKEHKDNLCKEKITLPKDSHSTEPFKHEMSLLEGYQFVDENGNVINATKIVLEKKKKEYPKSFGECCKVLGTYSYNQSIVGYKNELFSALQKLIICRDAYWKIAGEEMGLGKPWEPDDGTDIYNIYRLKNTIRIGGSSFTGGCNILEFPTEEMRDAFYENFKELIEQCKELL